MKLWTKEILKMNIWKILYIPLLVIFIHAGNFIRKFGMFMWYSEGAPNSHQIEWLLPSMISWLGFIIMLGAGVKIAMIGWDIWDQLHPKKNNNYPEE